MTPSQNLDTTSDTSLGCDRITATEWIDGVEHLVILERDGRVGYQEVSLTPRYDGNAVPGASDNDR